MRVSNGKPYIYSLPIGSSECFNRMFDCYKLLEVITSILVNRATDLGVTSDKNSLRFSNPFPILLSPT